MNIKYSVIVPVYNAEKYLDTCLCSLQKQKFYDCEFVVWNDGSTDSSRKIIEKYKTDKRFRVFEYKNMGAARARKNALKVSRGKYIMFLDSDDILADDALETIDIYMTPDLDLLQFISTSNLHELGNKNNNFAIKYYDREKFIKEYIRKVLIDGNEGVVLWNKVFKKNILEKCMNNYPYSMLEDYVFVMRYSVHVHKFCMIFSKLYYYRYVNNSLSRTLNPEWYKILLYVQELKEAYMEQIGSMDQMDKIYAASWFIRYVQNILYNNMLFIKKEDVYKILQNKKLIEQCQVVLNSKLDTNFAVCVRTAKLKSLYFRSYLIASIKIIIKQMKNYFFRRDK